MAGWVWSDGTAKRRQVLGCDCFLTSGQVGVGQVGLQEHGFSRLQTHHVEEVDAESARVPGELPVQLQDDLPFHRLQIISPFLWWRENNQQG